MGNEELIKAIEKLSGTIKTSTEKICNKLEWLIFISTLTFFATVFIVLSIFRTN